MLRWLNRVVLLVSVSVIRSLGEASVQITGEVGEPRSLVDIFSVRLLRLDPQESDESLYPYLILNCPQTEGGSGWSGAPIWGILKPRVAALAGKRRLCCDVDMNRC